MKNSPSHLSPLTSHLKIAFLGTPEIGAIVLGDLLKFGIKIEAVITQPDRPSGRGGKIQEPAVKKVALEHKISVYQPATKGELTASIQKINPDLCIVAAYGMMIPNEALVIPKYGMINFHPSLLPELRGPSPIPMTIMCGHKETGVSIIQIAEKMDAGDILAQRKITLKGNETTPTLSEKLAKIGAKMIVELLPKIESQSLQPIPQDDKKATFTPIIKKADGEIIFQKYHAKNIEQAARAFYLWPGVYTVWNGKKLSLFDITLSGSDPCEGRTLPAGVVAEQNDRIAIGTKKGNILIGSLQLEGKKKITAKEFLRGYRNFIDTKLS